MQKKLFSESQINSLLFVLVWEKILPSDTGKLETLFRLGGENAEIDKSNRRSALPKNAEVAEHTVQKLKEYSKAETSLGEGPDKARSELIIIDRGFDCTSPLLHELTLEAMSYDIGKIQDGKYKSARIVFYV